MAPSKSTKSPAFQFYPKEFLSSSKVIAMSMTERGIYITLLSTQWLDGGLPAELPALARLVGLNAKQLSRLWPHNLGRCFVVKAGRLVNPRLENIRQEQIAYRKRQAEHGAKGGRPNSKGLGSQIESQLETEKRSAPASASVSAPAPESGTHRQGGAPLHQSHKTHASCGRVCVPGDLHGQFVRARNHATADQELRDWYSSVDSLWSEGLHKDTNTGGNDYKFWRARFDERWPSASPVPKSAAARALDAWQPRSSR